MSQSFKDFFKDDNNVYSMSRLLVAGAFLVSSLILPFIASTESLSVYLGAFVINYGIGKVSETAGKFSNKEVKNADIQQ